MSKSSNIIAVANFIDNKIKGSVEFTEINLHLLTIQTPIFIKIRYIFIQNMSYIFFYVISFYCIIFFYHMNLLIFYNKKL
jgi:hypothetical protein